VSGGLRESHLENTSFATTDSSTALELQQWQQMWAHLVSMISDVVPTEPITAQSWTEKRLALVESVAQLIKLSRSGRRARGMRPECRHMAQEVQHNRAKLESEFQDVKEARVRRIAERVEDIRATVSAQLSDQRRLLQKLKEDDAHRQEILRKVTVTDVQRPAQDRHPRGDPWPRHVNKLIRTANRMQKDYQQLERQSKGASPDLSIDEISSLANFD
jgi:hypothetical protein